jgi:hypothetical protein
MAPASEAEPGLAAKVVAVDGALGGAAIDHAFGGALALAYYAEPRATIDIDVNVFVPPDEYPRVLDVLRGVGVSEAPPPATVERDGQARVWWARTPVDLFFSYDDVHDAMRRGARVVPFGDDQIPILAPEHLLAAKVIFDRPKDWIDVEQVLLAVPSLDADEVRRWVVRVAGAGDGRVAHWDRVVAEVLSRESPRSPG